MSYLGDSLQVWDVVTRVSNSLEVNTPVREREGEKNQRSLGELRIETWEYSLGLGIDGFGKGFGRISLNELGSDPHSWE